MIIDANCWCGHWPFRRLEYRGAEGLQVLQERVGCDLLLVSPLSAPFYRDCLSAVEEMLCEKGFDRKRMLPVAVINPCFPGWEDDLDVMVRELGCVAVRLIPGYHSYSLYSDEVVAAACKAAELGLPLVVTMRMMDERSHHPRMLVPPVSVEEVRYLLRQVPEGRFVLSHVLYSEVCALRAELELVAEGVWEISYKPPAFLVERAVREFGAERLLYGSAMPLQYPESILLMVQGADVSPAEKSAILSENARRVFRLEGRPW
jgi:predicted TIM-barrel fold metal-dependent hydrolase